MKKNGILLSFYVIVLLSVNLFSNGLDVDIKCKTGVWPGFEMKWLGEAGYVFQMYEPCSERRGIAMRVSNYMDSYKSILYLYDKEGQPSQLGIKLCGHEENSYFRHTLSIGTNSNEVNGLPYTLAVKGSIAAQEVFVTTTGWADYVLKNDYTLPDLGSVERHIKEKGTLPGIPDEEEVRKKGVDVGDMQVKLLAKVEELTLYMIEQNKKMEKITLENEQLKKKIESMGK